MKNFNEVLLTIGIPTFNSPSTLLQTLRSIENQQYLEYGSDLEILISDNASSYDIEDFLRTNLSTIFFNKLRININVQNLGYDKNLLKLMELAKGVYVKLLADDDILTDNFLIRYREFLASGSTGIIVNNFEFLDKEMTTVLKPSWFDLDKIASPETNFMGLDLCREAYGQVSSLTFKRDLVLSLNQPTKDTNYIHVYWFFSLLERYFVRFENEVLIRIRQGSPNFSGDGVINILTPLGGIKAILESNFVDDLLKQRLISAQEKYCLYQLSSLSRPPFKVRSLLFFEFVPLFKKSPQFWLFWAPFIVMPNFLRILLKRIRKLLHKVYFNVSYTDG